MSVNCKEMTGRSVIYTSESEITRENILKVLDNAMVKHELNRMDIEYLWNYYRGKQPILRKTKTVRPEINNKVLTNRANEIVNFKVGYLFGEPIQYVARNDDEFAMQGVKDLNEFMVSIDKPAQDKEIGEWQMICGTAYRIVLPSTDNEDSPFEIYTLDPRQTFVIYNNDIGHKPLMGVKYSYMDDAMTIKSISCYTETEYFRIEGNAIVEQRPHILGGIPIFEYPANNARLGAFEIVLPLLDALNEVTSNRLDGSEQFVQSFMKFINCDISSEDFESLREQGAIKVKSVDGANADVDMISQELNQTQTQTLVDDINERIMIICGMPSQSDGKTSDSSNNGAVIIRNGWQNAEARAKDSEVMFKQAESKMLKMVLRICNEVTRVALRVKDIEMKFTRRNYENIASKSTVLTQMLSNPKIHPLLAYEHCGMFSDPEGAYQMSMSYYNENVRALEETFNEDEQE